MGSEFMADVLELDGFRFDLFWPSMKKVYETTDWILMVDLDTKELYGGYVQHDTRFLKKYERLEGQKKEQMICSFFC